MCVLSLGGDFVGREGVCPSRVHRVPFCVSIVCPGSHLQDIQADPPEFIDVRVVNFGEEANLRMLGWDWGWKGYK